MPRIALVLTASLILVFGGGCSSSGTSDSRCLASTVTGLPIFRLSVDDDGAATFIAGTIFSGQSIYRLYPDGSLESKELPPFGEWEITEEGNVVFADDQATVHYVDLSTFATRTIADGRLAELVRQYGGQVWGPWFFDDGTTACQIKADVQAIGIAIYDASTGKDATFLFRFPSEADHTTARVQGLWGDNLVITCHRQWSHEIPEEELLGMKEGGELPPTPNRATTIYLLGLDGQQELKVDLAYGVWDVNLVPSGFIVGITRGYQNNFWVKRISLEGVEEASFAIPAVDGWSLYPEFTVIDDHVLAIHSALHSDNPDNQIVYIGYFDIDTGEEIHSRIVNSRSRFRPTEIVGRYYLYPVDIKARGHGEIALFDYDQKVDSMDHRSIKLGDPQNPTYFITSPNGEFFALGSDEGEVSIYTF